MADPNDLTITARWEWPAPPVHSVSMRFPAQSPEVVRAALDDVMAPIRALADAHMAGMETAALEVLRSLTSGNNAMPDVEAMVDAINALGEVRDETLGAITADQPLFFGVPVPVRLEPRLSDLVKPGPWAPCDACGDPTRVVRKAGGRRVHLLCFATEWGNNTPRRAR